VDDEPESSLPAIVNQGEAVPTTILQLIEPGRTTIHNYPGEEARATIWRVLLDWAKSHHKKRVPLTQVVVQLNEQFPGLDLSPATASYAIEAFICPALAKLMPSIVQRALVEIGADLDTTTSKFRRRMEVEKQIAEMEGIPEDMRGKGWRANYMSLNKIWLALTESGEQGLERFKIIDPIVQHSEVKKEERRLNIDATLDKMGIKDPIDARFSTPDRRS